MKLKLRVSPLQGEHRHVSVFMGPDDDHLALCGMLRMRENEWTAIEQMLTENVPYTYNGVNGPELRLGFDFGEDAPLSLTIAKDING